jgi:hypothetical protein
MKEIPEFKYNQPGNKFLFNKIFRKFYDLLREKERTWTELKNKTGLRDSELKRILTVAKKEDLVFKRDKNYYVSPKGIDQTLLINSVLTNLCKVNKDYQNYNLKNTLFFSGIKREEVDTFILSKADKIKNIYRMIREYLLKNRRKEISKVFEVELRKIKSKDAKEFLRCNKSAIFKRLYGNQDLYQRGPDLFFITLLPYCLFIESAKRQDLLSQDIVKIETFNLFYGLFDKIIFPEILILPEIKLERLKAKKKSNDPASYLKIQEFLLKNSSLLRL